MAEELFTDADKAQIKAAIIAAEKNTSGEIRVHIEKTCPGDVMDKAAQIFAALDMHKTKLRNGVLIYIALKDHKFAILGDAGINAVVPTHFWEDIKETMFSQFKESKIAEGLCEGIRMAGEQLKAHFSYEKGDVNELTDEISFGKEQ